MVIILMVGIIAIISLITMVAVILWSRKTSLSYSSAVGSGQNKKDETNFDKKNEIENGLDLKAISQPQENLKPEVKVTQNNTPEQAAPTTVSSPTEIEIPEQSQVQNKEPKKDSRFKAAILKIVTHIKAKLKEERIDLSVPKGSSESVDDYIAGKIFRGFDPEKGDFTVNSEDNLVPSKVVVNRGVLEAIWTWPMKNQAPIKKNVQVDYRFFFNPDEPITLTKILVESRDGIVGTKVSYNSSELS